MTIVADAGGILAAINTDADSKSKNFRTALNEADTAVITPMVVTEVHYMLAGWGEHSAAAQFLRDIARGDYELVNPTADDYSTAANLVEKYQGTMRRKRRKPGSVDLADAMNMIAAEKYGTNLILATDQDYRATTPLTRHPYYVILPEDETN